MSQGRINVYIGEEPQHALKVAAVSNKQTIGQYLAALLCEKFKLTPKQHPDEVQARNRVSKKKEASNAR